MSDVPVQVIVAAFKEENGASEALKQLKQAKKEKLIGIQDAAVLRCDAKGKLHIHETADWGGGKGAVAGGVVGAVIGAFAGALVVPIGVGALVGGLWAKLRDSGFPDQRLKELGSALKPGTSALIAVIEHTWVIEAQKMLEEAGADVVTESLKADIAQQLEAGHDVAYTALSTAGVTVAGRMTESEEQGKQGETQPAKSEGEAPPKASEK